MRSRSKLIKRSFLGYFRGKKHFKNAALVTSADRYRNNGEQRHAISTQWGLATRKGRHTRSRGAQGHGPDRYHLVSGLA